MKFRRAAVIAAVALALSVLAPAGAADKREFESGTILLGSDERMCQGVSSVCYEIPQGATSWDLVFTPSLPENTVTWDHLTDPARPNHIIVYSGWGTVIQDFTLNWSYDD